MEEHASGVKGGTAARGGPPPSPCSGSLPTNTSSDVLLLEMVKLLEGHNRTRNVGLLLRSKSLTTVPSV